MGDDQVAGVGLLGHSVEQLTEALDIGVVEGSVDLVEHADRRRVGQEQSEDQRDRGQRLLAPRQQGQGRQALARRLGHDLEPGLERVVALDQLEMRLAALEQGREQATEMRVDFLVGVEQPDSPFAVQIADRAAQPVDRLGQLVGFLGTLCPGCVELGELRFRDQVDRADPLPFRGQPFERGCFLVGVARFVGVEAELFRKALGDDFELLERRSSELGAARLLGLGSSRRGRAPLAHVGRAFVPPRNLQGRRDHGFLGLALGGGRFAHVRLALVVGMLELGDPGVELGGLLVQIAPLHRLLFLPLERRGEALLGIPLALPPLRLLTTRHA